jgi:L-rhamnose mutarotase
MDHFMSTRKPGLQSRSMGGLIHLLPEFEERYIILHNHTFPGVLRQIRASHIGNYSIFLKDGLLFSHLEYLGRDFGADMKMMADDRTTRDWWKLTDPMQRPLPTRKKGEWWASLECLAQLAPHPASSGKVRRFAFVTRVKPGKASELRVACRKDIRTIERVVARARFQNIHLYLHGRRLHLYAEYTGRDIEADALQLYRSASFSRWRERIEKHCRPGSSWEQMTQVFHIA